MTSVDHIQGQTFHGRRGAVENAFRYGIDYVMLDAEAPAGGPALFGRNRRGFFSLQDSDHGGEPKKGYGALWARAVLEAHGLDDVTDGKLMLLAQPRVMGHVFNPVSFWIANDRQGRLRAVIAEVSNTFGDRHSYLCAHHDHRVISREDTLTATKIFHVSPFQPIEGGYSFRFDIRPDKIGIWIDFSTGNEGVMATLTGPRVQLTNGSILRAALRRPFGSRRVLSLIHWQALKLWWKGARYRPRPEPPVEDVSR
jgi:DUF1365 family protein